MFLEHEIHEIGKFKHRIGKIKRVRAKKAFKYQTARAEIYLTKDEEKKFNNGDFSTILRDLEISEIVRWRKR
jgi:hypothetical protein